MEGEILKFLTNKYNKATLTKKEVATELGLSLRSIDNYIKDGFILPKPLKIGGGEKSSVRFSTIDIATFIADAIVEIEHDIEERSAKEEQK